MEIYMICEVPEKAVACVTSIHILGENLAKWPYISERQQVNIDQLGSRMLGFLAVSTKERRIVVKS